MPPSAVQDIRKEYGGCKIINIHRGKGERSIYIYADLVDENGQILISATIDYIMEKLPKYLPEPTWR